MLARLRAGPAAAHVPRPDRLARRGLPKRRAADAAARGPGPHDRLQKGTKARWFAIPIPIVGNFPLPDPAVGSHRRARARLLLPILDPVGAALSVILGGVEAVAALDDQGAMQRLIRKQQAESDLDFLLRIARENGWELMIDHSGPLGGHQLRFLVPARPSRPRRRAALRALAARLHAAGHRRRADRLGHRPCLGRADQAELHGHGRLGLGPGTLTIAIGMRRRAGGAARTRGRDRRAAHAASAPRRILSASSSRDSTGGSPARGSASAIRASLPGAV